MDQLDITDRHYERKCLDMEKRMDAFYDEIERIEKEFESVQHQITVIRKQKITAENIYEFLYLYNAYYVPSPLMAAIFIPPAAYAPCVSDARHPWK